MSSRFITTRVQGMTRLLFDRLTDHDFDTLEEDPQTYILTKDQYKSSIVQQLTSLLNTRRTCKKHHQNHEEDLKAGPFQDYGLDDLMWLQMSNQQSFGGLARQITHVIEKYEPRLISVKVKIIGRSSKQTGLIIHIQGQIHFNGQREQVHFPLTIM